MIDQTFKVKRKCSMDCEGRGFCLWGIVRDMVSWLMWWFTRDCLPTYILIWKSVGGKTSFSSLIWISLGSNETVRDMLPWSWGDHKGLSTNLSYWFRSLWVERHYSLPRFENLWHSKSKRLGVAFWTIDLKSAVLSVIEMNGERHLDVGLLIVRGS